MVQHLTLGKGFEVNTRWLAIGAIAVGGAVTVGGFLFLSPFASLEPEKTVSEVVEIKTVTALGRLEPVGEVLHLSAPSSNQNNRIAQLFVKEGDRLNQGQTVAILDSYGQLTAALAEAEERVKLAQAQLAVVKAGAKQGEIDSQSAEIARIEAQYQGDIATQSATVRRLEAEVQNALVEKDRYQMLFDAGAISASQRDSKNLILQTAQSSLQEAQASLQRTQATNPENLSRARATLAQIAEVRPVDIQVAQADVDRAIAAKNQAQANLDQAVVYAPIAGEVLFIHTRPGEVVSSDGIIEIGQTETMQAVGEVYQSDISKVQPGQKVRISSSAIAGDLYGTVERVGSQVLRQSVVNTDPSVNIDARVVEVYALLDAESSAKAAKFTNLQVQMEIAQ
ncbi:MAG: ABC exporter membrane fusion protein [Limnothrix sp. RL_2_0]|nr:ABC exporter membrane fusion protein [Limnothrix sp. RL_2_0]